MCMKKTCFQKTFVAGIIEREPEHDLLVIFIVVASPSVLIP